MIGLQDGRVVFDLPAKAVDPERLAELYAQEAIPDSSDLLQTEENTSSTAMSTQAMVRCR